MTGKSTLGFTLVAEEADHDANLQSIHSMLDDMVTKAYRKALRDSEWRVANGTSDWTGVVD